MPEYLLAHSNEEYTAVAALFSEYAQWLGIDLAFQGFEEELQQLKTMYNDADGGIWLCKEAGQFVGCVAVRRKGDGIAELKRMYVQPGQQGKGIGKVLLEKSLRLAADLGYVLIRLDTLNDMLPAISLYRQYGFYEIPAYYFNPDERAVYFEKKL